MHSFYVISTKVRVRKMRSRTKIAFACGGNHGNNSDTGIRYYIHITRYKKKFHFFFRRALKITGRTNFENYGFILCMHFSFLIWT